MPAFPTVAAPIVAWFDGTLSEYTDAGGTVVAAPGDLVRRIKEASPSTAHWDAVTDNQRPARVANGLRMDPFGPSYPGNLLVRSAAPALTSINDCTMVVSYVPRDGYGGPPMGLCACSLPTFGCYDGGGAFSVFVNGSSWVPFAAGPAVGGSNSRGKQISVGVRWGSAQVRASMLTGGVTTPASQTVTVTSGTLSQPLYIGYPFAGSQGQYGQIGQVILFDGQLSDLELANVLAWCEANPLPSGYPLDQPLLEVVSDSIWRAGVGTQVEQSAWSIVLKTIRSSTAPGAELCNVGVVGAGAGNACYTNQLQAVHSASRVKEVALVSVGSNNLANGQSAASTIAAVYGLCDLMRADGIEVILQDILHRQGLFNTPGDQAFFDTAVATVNADFAANWRSHADAFVAAASIAGLNNPANATYYQGDKVHLTDAGQALLAAAALPKFVALLTAGPGPSPAEARGVLTIERVLDWTSEPAVYLFSLANSALSAAPATPTANAVTAGGVDVVVGGVPVSASA